MGAVALSVTLKAKPGKEEELGTFLAGAQALVAQENGTVSWFAYRVDAQTFGIFDSFNDEAGRQAHLNGAVAAALLGRAEELLAEKPDIRPVDILAEKLPG
jgi:quinol monooxygenase YgiN